MTAATAGGPLRVLHVIPSVAPRDGGPSVAVREMAAGVARLGADVSVVATDADGDGRLDVPSGVPRVEGGVTYRYFRRSIPGSWKCSLPLARWLYANARDFDVVHVHALFSFATLPGCRAADRARVPYILRPLGTLDPWSLDQRSWKKGPYLALVERRHLERASAIHVTSLAERDAVAALGYGARARVIGLGVHMPEPCGRSSSATGGPLRLLFLSRLHPKKNLPLLFDALRRLDAGGRRDIALTVAGDGEAAYVAELSQRARTAGLGGRVEFVGHLAGAAKAAAFCASDVFVLPSSQENFGIAVAEAMSYGLPVVVSDQVALASEVAASGAGAVVTLDASELARAIETVGEPGRRAVMSRAARETARDRFSWQRTSRDLMALYTSLPDDRRGLGRGPA